MKDFLKNRQHSRSEGLIVDLNERLFYYLGKISLFTLLRRNRKIKDMHNFVDSWVISNILLSIIMSYLIVKFINNKVILSLAFFYAFLRVFEIIVYQINVNLFDRYRSKLRNKDYRIKSPTRTVILLLYNYIEIIFWYVIMIVAILKLSNCKDISRYKYYIESSFLCLTTLNYELVASMAKSQYQVLSSIAILEVVSGLVMTIISLANFIGKLPSEYRKEFNKKITKKRNS
ncbi:hypothetical protein Curi_c02490 [Gottschalkia acidurici 9a]|uniref:Uncharacterized protein n=1 Tax=Gottschalkia acidurici (strain ATCC 7906 / DSM 604 / BCRC 14475 / CIP 104303 / KCTC 5404 / NCIMB 10678 / 9a) TaxID=1128398 RepID=K0AVM3_GOTA9|nr:hypothetical protein [Gottschalkia acidurici]AFS77329.1 hypothetical protein Curi_c02490 [Gottschalkia acidurici 9a]